ncbi:tyrosine-type recombinase/integrase [Salibacterium qingdaonense]|uniref:Site-specific recombinase XerD n=1 Tax=Salibacterium qingdaonense TaxID=266892 RepID=A0A1I4IP15_9BACI|nr:site-specific integrase [Salibacterium qingdaonense]SFL55733.1 Site-specific recombinase XerD [Salibacterium qingdaonense]
MKITYGIHVEIAQDNNDIRYMITEDGIPIQDACLWLDFISVNSYLTGERYAYALLRYFRFLKANRLHYRQVTSKRVIEEYIKELLGLGEKVINYESRLTFTALNTYITVLKSFYHWLEDEKKVSTNPVLYSSKRTRQAPLVNTKLLYGQIWQFDIEETLLSRVTYRRKRNHLKWYSEQEYKSIQSNLPSLRDKIVFVLSVETGMRIGEILGLKIYHFDPFNPSLEIVREQNIENRSQAKTTERTLYIYQSLAEMIQTYMGTERSEVNILELDYLFLNSKGKHMGKPLKPRNFLRILKNAGEKAGLTKSEIRTHSGRSSRAQQLVELMRDHPELGITKTFINEELGWKSERSIQPYEKGYSMQQKRKIMDRIEPVILEKKKGCNYDEN